MINNSSQSGYYDMDNNMVIGDNSSEVDVPNTPFSVRDILNIDQNSEVNHYQNMNGDQLSQKYYGGGMSQFGNNSQYKR